MDNCVDYSVPMGNDFHLSFAISESILAKLMGPIVWRTFGPRYCGKSGSTKVISPANLFAFQFWFKIHVKMTGVNRAWGKSTTPIPDFPQALFVRVNIGAKT